MNQMICCSDSTGQIIVIYSKPVWITPMYSCALMDCKQQLQSAHITALCWFVAAFIPSVDPYES